MHKSNKFAYANIIQMLLDALTIAACYGVSYLIATSLTTMRHIQSYAWILMAFLPIWIFMMAFWGMYNRTTFYYFDRMFRSVILSSSFAGLFLAAMFFFIKETSTSRIFIMTFILSVTILSFIERCISSLLIKRLKDAGDKITNIIVAGDHDTCQKYHQYLHKTQIRNHIAGYIQVGETAPVKGKFNLGPIDKLEEILKTHVVDEVVFALPKNFTDGVEHHVQLCERMGLTARVLLNLYDLELSRVHIAMLGPLPMVTYHTVSLNPVQKAMKRALDIAGGIVGILITCIVGLVIVPLIKLDSPGPAIFKQRRVGLNGRHFDFYKFRTMCADAESKKKDLQSKNTIKDGMMFKIENDPRITKIGGFLRKTSLDELPQFLNVLRGDMSLVGTRPPTLDEVSRYEPEHWRRMSIKPGITGMWQVSGRSDIKDFEQVVALDTEYIDNWSVWSDINILFRTVWQVVRRKAAY